MTAEAMQEVGLRPKERNPHPDDDEVSDHVEFFSSLAGQLAGLKVSLDDTLE